MTTNKPARPSVRLVDGHATTTSTALAQFFGKRHYDVLRAIENLKAECEPEFYERNFAFIQIDVDLGQDRTRKDPAYQLTRDGFTLLAMGFTGKAALAWKIKYIEAFNKLEQRATKRAVTLATRKIKADQAAERRKALSVPSKPEPLALPDKIDRDLQHRINQRAWTLSHASYEMYRQQMQGDIMIAKGHAKPEDWQPVECQRHVLQSIEVAATVMNSFANTLRNDGRRLAGLVGLDFDIAKKFSS